MAKNELTVMLHSPQVVATELYVKQEDCMNRVDPNNNEVIDGMTSLTSLLEGIFGSVGGVI